MEIDKHDNEICRKYNKTTAFCSISVSCRNYNKKFRKYLKKEKKNLEMPQDHWLKICC